jgi:hypothetical protein
LIEDQARFTDHLPESNPDVRVVATKRRTFLPLLLCAASRAIVVRAAAGSPARPDLVIVISDARG